MARSASLLRHVLGHAGHSRSSSNHLDRRAQQIVCRIAKQTIVKSLASTINDSCIICSCWIHETSCKLIVTACRCVLTHRCRHVSILFQNWGSCSVEILRTVPFVAHRTRLNVINARFQVFCQLNLIVGCWEEIRLGGYRQNIGRFCLRTSMFY